jgi:hypothetical protein
VRPLGHCAQRNRQTAMSRLGYIGAVVLAGLSIGCTAGNDLGGTWRVTERPLLGDKLVFDENSGEPDVGIELMIGHYGPDLAGLVRFYRTTKFQFPRSALKPDGDCACTFMHNGQVSADNTKMEFDLRGCLPGAATRAQLLVRAELELDAGGQLDGRWRVLDDNKEWSGKSQQFTFTRTGPAGAVDSRDLICETPDQDVGNIYNGG